MKVTFIITDVLYETEMNARHRRSVTIDLTLEQQRQLNIQFTGIHNGEPQYETITDCFIEQSSEAAHE